MGPLRPTPFAFVTHERFAKARRSIVLLRAADLLQRFHTARVFRDRSHPAPMPTDVRFAPSNYQILQRRDRSLCADFVAKVRD